MNGNPISRRTILKSAVAAFAILGFDPLSRSWITDSSANTAVDLPLLDGVLLTGSDTLDEASVDFGNIKRRQPFAVLKPGSVDDIIRMVDFAREQRLSISARGQGHTTFGQSLVEAGVVIDMSSLNTLPEIHDDRVKVSAGMLWRDVLLATVPHGLTVPVITGYLGLSVGGTLSVGGIGNSSYRYGAQVDNVIELEVVTGQGKLEVCSATHKPDLFEAALAGLGQCAIIISATTRLIPALTHARVFNLFYADIPTMLRDERHLITDGRFDDVLGYVVPSPGGWVMFIEAVSHFSNSDDLNNTELFEGLSFIPDTEQVVDMAYFDYANRVTGLIDFVRSTGRINLPHPWFDVFIPDSKIDDFVGGVFANLTPEDLGPDFPILFFPLKTQHFHRPLLRVPNEEVFWLFDILSTAPDTLTSDTMISRNRTLFEQARNFGSKHYTISAIPLSQHDWQRHFHPFWGKLLSAKHRFDPDNILTPGPGIFANDSIEA